MDWSVWQAEGNLVFASRKRFFSVCINLVPVGTLLFPSQGATVMGETLETRLSPYLLGWLDIRVGNKHHLIAMFNRAIRLHSRGTWFRNRTTYIVVHFITPMSFLRSGFSLYYNIMRVLPYLIPIGVIMVHFSTYARPCVHKMTCATCRHTRVSVT